MTSPNTSGATPLPNEIQNNQTQSNNFDVSHVICNSDGTIDVKGQVVFDPPLPVVDGSKIFSPDLSSQLQCINGGQITVLGEIQGYSTTAQTNSNIGIAIGNLSTVYMPIDQTLNDIPLATGTIDVNDQQIDNLSDPTDLLNAVNLQYLQNNYTDTIQSEQFVNAEIDLLSSVYMPIDQTLNDIPLATGTVDLNQQQINNLADPTSSLNAINLQYIQNNYTNTTNSQIFVGNAIGDLSTVYMPINQTLNNIPLATGSLNVNNNKIINLTAGTNSTDAVCLSQLDGYIPVSGNINDLTAQTADYSTSGFQINNSTLPASGDNLTNKTYVDGEISALSTVYYPQTDTLNDIAVPTQTLNLNSQKIENLLPGTQQNDAINKQQLDNDFKDMIRNTSGSCNVQAVISGIDVTIDNEADKLKFFISQGQATKPACMYTNDKLQFVSGLGSISFNSELAQDQSFNNFGIYQQQPNNDMTKNQNAQFMLQCKNSSGSQQSQALTLATGHINLGLGMQNYSFLYNAPDGVQQNLQLSGGTPQTDNTLVLYSDSFATAISQPLSAQFTKKTGYSATTAITEANQFSSKAYVDSAISGISSIYLTIANAASTYQTIANMTNYYTKGVADATFATIASLSLYVTTSSLSSTLSSYLTIANASATYLTQASASSLYQTLSGMGDYLTTASASTLYYTQTYINDTFATIASLSNYVLTSTTLNNLTAPTGSLNMNSQNIINLLDPTTAQMAATKNYVDTQSGSGITLATAKANFIALDGTQTNLISAPIPMNSQKITGLANGTDATDAVNLSQLSSNINSAISGVSQVLTGTVQMWATNSAPSGYFLCDGSTYSSATYPALFAILGSTTLPDFRDKFARGYSSTSGRTFLDTQQDAYENHTHLIASQTYSTVAGGSHNHTLPTRSASGNTGGTALGNASSQGNVTVTGGEHTHSVIIPDKNTNLSTTGSSETRPINICLSFIVKH